MMLAIFLHGLLPFCAGWGDEAVLYCLVKDFCGLPTQQLSLGLLAHRLAMMPNRLISR